MVARGEVDLSKVGRACACASVGAAVNVAATAQLTCARHITAASATLPAELLTSGTFGVVQHPISTGSALLVFGLVLDVAPLCAPSWIGLAWLLQHLHRAAELEEAYLARTFGAHHTLYAAITPKFVPAIDGTALRRWLPL